MRDWPTHIALLATSASALLVLVLYSPALAAPFLVPKFAALELSAALCAVAFALERLTSGNPRWSRRVATGALLVLGTTALSWVVARGRPEGAPYAADALARWASLFGIACGASVLADAPDARRQLAEAITLAAAIVAGVGLLQHVGMLPSALSIPVFSTPGSTFGNRNIAADVMAMALPFGVAASLGAGRRARGGERIVLGVATGLELVFLAVTRARGAWLGAACGLGAVVWLERAAWTTPTRGPRTARIGAFAALVVAVVAESLPARFDARDAGDTKRYAGVGAVLEGALDARSPALRTRLGFWRRTMRMISDAPWLGVGPGNWPVQFPRYAEPGATEDGVLDLAVAPRQAHDDVLERTAETGLVGLLALGYLGVAVVAAARRRLWRDAEADARSAATGASGALVAMTVVSLAAFPLEMPATLALTGLALGLVAPEPPHAKAVRGGGRRARVAPVLVLGAALFVAVAIRAERHVRASRWLGVAERALHRDRGVRGAEEALAALRESLAAAPGAYAAELRASQMMRRESRALEAIDAAQRALAAEPYSVNAWGALAAAEKAAGHVDEARAAATRALELLRDYPLALYVRATLDEQNGTNLERAATDRAALRTLADSSADADTRRTAQALLETGE